MIFLPLIMTNTVSTLEKERPYLQHINYFRGIAIIFIVFGHCFNLGISQYYQNTTLFAKLIRNLLPGGTTFFVFVSGLKFELTKLQSLISLQIDLWLYLHFKIRCEKKNCPSFILTYSNYRSQNDWFISRFCRKLVQQRLVSEIGFFVKESYGLVTIFIWRCALFYPDIAFN